MTNLLISADLLEIGDVISVDGDEITVTEVSIGGEVMSVTGNAAGIGRVFLLVLPTQPIELVR